MKGIPCGVWDILMDLVALFGVEIHALKVTYQHFNGGPFRAVPGGICFQIFFHGLRVGGDGEGHLGPVVFPGCMRCAAPYRACAVDSAKKYISLDSKNLKECALDFNGIEVTR